MSPILRLVSPKIPTAYRPIKFVFTRYACSKHSRHINGCAISNNMSPIPRLVSPKLPTALVAHAHVDLPGYDLWLHTINNVHIIPTKLDVPRFEEALSKTLQLYPHASGQLRYTSDGCWSIELTNSPVPVDIEYKLNTSSDSFLDGNWVVQDDISPFLNHQPVGANLVNGGASLLRFKLTIFNNETCIGVSWHHTLGDAITLSRFMHALSQVYQDLPLEHAAPTFRKCHFPVPASSVSAEFWPLMPHLHDSRPFSELREISAELRKHVEHLKWRFNIDDLIALRSTLSDKQDGKYLSIQDCLSAYLVTVLNHNTSTPIQSVGNISTYRDVCAPFIDKDVAGNLMQVVPASVPTDMSGIAIALRHALERSREPGYVYNWMAVASNHMLETAIAGKSFHVAGAVNVNSNVRIDWCDAHFGCPDGSRFHTIGVSKGYLRCYRSNPIKGDDGVWRARRSVDVSMGSEAELKPRLLETLGRGVPFLLNNGLM